MSHDGYDVRENFKKNKPERGTKYWVKKKNKKTKYPIKFYMHF